VFGAFCRRPKCAKHEEAESKPLHNHQASGLASEAVRPSPQARPNGACTTNVARPSGRYISSLSLKERKQNIVKPKQKVIRKS